MNATDPHDQAPGQNPGQNPVQNGGQAPGQDAGQDPNKDVDDWVTGGEPATGPQLSYLHTLAREAGEELPSDLTKAQASQMIDRLQQASPRTGGGGTGGAGASGPPDGPRQG
ncbi:DUF3072 domain-containing protein [Streptomyces sp. NPDC047097]|uniref:DUF3072 domain-containing protein n=1 Tax=Streptomyces sp. NPDC047097 TaxID=3155260 RepID=UPI0033E50934